MYKISSFKSVYLLTRPPLPTSCLTALSALYDQNISTLPGSLADEVALVQQVYVLFFSVTDQRHNAAATRECWLNNNMISKLDTVLETIFKLKFAAWLK